LQDKHEPGFPGVHANKGFDAGFFMTFEKIIKKTHSLFNIHQHRFQQLLNLKLKAKILFNTSSGDT